MVAKGKGLEIKRRQFDDEVIRAKAAYAASGMAAPPNLDQQVLDNLIGAKLVLGKATDADRAKGKEEFEKFIQKRKTDAKLTDEEFNQQVGRQLRLQRQTREEWEKQSTDQATIRAALERELKVNISDEEVKKFYDDNPSKFEQPEMVHVSHILLSTRDLIATPPTDLPEDKKAAKHKRAEEVLKRAKAGEDFAKLAKEFSEDPNMKTKGPEATLPRGQMGVPIEFDAAAFSLKTNQLSDIVTTQYGYHIIKLLEKIPARKDELEKAAPQIKKLLEAQARDKQIPDYVAKLKKDAAVEVLDEKLKLPDLPPAKGDAKGGAK